LSAIQPAPAAPKAGLFQRFSRGLPRLYFSFYVALLVVLLLFAMAVLQSWGRSGGPLERSNATLSRVMMNVLAPPDAPHAQQQAALEKVAAGLNAHMTLYTRDWRPLAVVGDLIPARHWRQRGITGPPPESYVRLPDGRRVPIVAGIQVLDSRLDEHGLLGTGARFIHLEGAHARQLVQWLRVQAEAD